MIRAYVHGYDPCRQPPDKGHCRSLLQGWVVGLEPTISRTTIWRANQLRYTHHRDVIVPFRALTSLAGTRMCSKGFEPPTHGLEGRCSIQLSYRHKRAGDGNRTHVSSLEGWCSTIELHPHVVGVTGFEPATSWSQTRRSSQAEPHPGGTISVTQEQLYGCPAFLSIFFCSHSVQKSIR